MGTNNRADFFALQNLLKMIKDKEIKCIQTLGDSNMLMDQANGKCQITNLAIEPIMNRVLELKSHFDQTTFTHIYRSSNLKVDSLFKVALNLQEDILSVQE